MRIQFVYFCEFINNRASSAVIYIPYTTTAENLTNNVFIDNKWMSSKLLERKPKELPSNDAPEELDDYQLERSATGDQKQPTVTLSVVEFSQPTQNYND